MIHFEDFKFYYKKNKVLLETINIELEKGKIYGLFGKNGTGKTTFLKSICGLVFPKSGSVTVGAFTPKDRKVNFLNSIYYVPDEFTMPKLTVNQFVDYYSTFYPKFSQSEFEDYLLKFEVAAVGKPSDFSLGQQKKFMISFALACNTEILLMDEPTNGLDIPSKNMFRKIVANVITDDKVMLISTHQARDLENLLDHLLILDKAEFVLNNSTYEITRKLKFKQQQFKPELQDCISFQQVANGYNVLEENIDGMDTNIDVEHLMAAVLANPETFKQIFTNTKTLA